MTDVVNIVASGSLNREFDTAELADTTSLPVTKRTQDGRVYFDFPSVDPTVSLSRTGQYLTSGGVDIESVRNARDALIQSLEEAGADIDTESIEDPEISNIVFSGELEPVDNSIDLGQVAQDLGLEQAFYEPEQFAQVVYEPDELDCVILIFSTGKINITGCTEFETGNKAMELIQSKLQVE